MRDHLSANEGAPAGSRFPLLIRAWPPVTSLLLVALLAAVASRPYRSFDTYFHLRFGSEFRDTWSLRHPGHVTSAASNDWAPTQWLPQVVVSWIAERSEGALALVLATLLAGFAGAAYLYLRSRTRPGTAMTLTLAVVVGCLPYLTGRPQVLSYLFLVGVLASWDLARRTGRAPWWLVPLGWVWAMSHGMWVLGVAASLVLAVGVCWQQRASRPHDRLMPRALRLLAVPAGMLGAACLTPVGPRLVGAVLQVGSRSEHFAEWAAPELLTLGAAPVTLLLALAVLLTIRRDRVEPYDVALLGLGVLFSIYSQRTLPLALVVLAAVVAGELGRLRRRTGGRPGEQPGSGAQPGSGELAFVGVLAAAVVVVAGLLPLRDVPASEVEPFADVLADLPARSMVLTDRATGAVLLWTDQDLDVPIHGYGDVYTDAELEAYDDLARLEPGWKRTLERLGAQVALLPEDDRVAAALQDHGWQVVRTSDDLVYLVAPPAGG
ncbi:hypothetical protein KG112_05870 [Nocardioides sp. zg-ZUI104]|uniref:hypothetical protein n=1 Tax=Nocardioides faecalis TaxID=2803858 RepID=UPI001BD1A581|nr:hypothetical protein [Nocardioides faecalis]MBS4752335.1 hypothetical protein [Nocardioides faecalis]